MILGALGTIRAETEGFVPISGVPVEVQHPAGRRALQPLRPRKIGNQPARATAPATAAAASSSSPAGQLHTPTVPSSAATSRACPTWPTRPRSRRCCWPSSSPTRRSRSAEAVAKDRLDAARKLVNGGSHGLRPLQETSSSSRPSGLAGDAPVAGRRGRQAPGRGRRCGQRKAGSSVSRTRRTRPTCATGSTCRRRSACRTNSRRRRTCGNFLPAYTQANLILDQGQEGACTGFGLSLRHQLPALDQGRPAEEVRLGEPAHALHAGAAPRRVRRRELRRLELPRRDQGLVQPRRLPGGGLALRAARSRTRPEYGFATRAIENTLGVYYRIDTKSITDMQAAISQHGAVFVSAFTHEGWDDACRGSTSPRRAMPTAAGDRVRRPGRRRPAAMPSRWSASTRAASSCRTPGAPDWGAGGFAVLTLPGLAGQRMDAWVVALGVPRRRGRPAGRAVDRRGRRSPAPTAASGGTRAWPTSTASCFGNDGRVSRYLTEDEQPRKLQQQVFALPDQWFRAQPGRHAPSGW